MHLGPSTSNPCNGQPVTGDLRALFYGYGTTSNNGNVLSQSIYDGSTTKTHVRSIPLIIWTRARRWSNAENTASDDSEALYSKPLSPRPKTEVLFLGDNTHACRSH